MRKIYLSFFVIISLSAKAQTPNPIQTAVPFLRLTPDAAAAGKGETGIATTPDVHSIFWNTAKLPFDKDKFGVSTTYSPLPTGIIESIYLFDASAFYKIDSFNALTASLRYFSLGNITFTSASGQVAGTFNPHEYTLHLGYARRLGKYFSIGANLGYVSSNLTSGQSITGVPVKNGTSPMGDLSFYFTHPAKNKFPLRDYSLGLTIANIGKKISHSDYIYNPGDFLPANLGLGGSLHFEIAEVHHIRPSLDLNKLLVPTPVYNSAGININNSASVLQGALNSFSDAPGGLKEELQEIIYSAGIEYSYKDIIMLRTGYHYENPNKGNMQYLTIGAGGRYKVIELELSYNIITQQGYEENSFRISLSFSLPNKHN